jgi:uracil phosphoribosyltransferase
MTVINLAEQKTILNNFVEELRHVEVQKDPMRFRRNLERIGEIMAFEISKRLSYKQEETTTPLGISKSMIMNDNLVIATILRAGLPMHQGFLNIFDRAKNAFVSAYRKYTDKEHFEIHVEYISAPDISGKTLILIDPMLATGASFELAFEALLSKGKPGKTFMACAIASREGVTKLSENPALVDIELWCAAIDSKLNSKSYIVPGLGDAGDLAFGIKE